MFYSKVFTRMRAPHGLKYKLYFVVNVCVYFICISLYMMAYRL